MWYKNKGQENDVAVSTRVRLARNLNGYPFDGRLNDGQKREIIEKVWSVFEGKSGWTLVDFSSLPAVERASYAERHIVSPEFAKKQGPCALIANEERSVYIMVLEEDHLRIQAISAADDAAKDKAGKSSSSADTKGMSSGVNAMAEKAAEEGGLLAKTADTLPVLPAFGTLLLACAALAISRRQLNG